MELTFVVVAFLVLSQIKIMSLIRKNKSKNILIAEMQMEDILSHILHDTMISRAVIAKIHNGGSQITIGSQKKVSVLIEPAESLRPYTKENYTSVPIDRFYQATIIRMIEAGGGFIFDYTYNLPPGMYRRKVEGDLIRGAFHYHITDTESGIYYVFLATTMDPDLILSDPRQINTMSEGVMRIRKILKKNIIKSLFK